MIWVVAGRRIFDRGYGGQIGRDGSEEILASDVADQAGTISNEILSRLGKRLGRVITQVPDEILSDTVPVLRR